MTETRKTTTIATDAMGGDYAPEEIVAGAVAAARHKGLEPVLVGPLDILEPVLAKYDTSGLSIRCVQADDFIKEGENPALLAHRKPNSSIGVAIRMVKSGEAQGVLGATNTGALVASAMQSLGMLDGIDRPVIGGVLSGVAPKTAIFDLGVNMDCKPQHLLTFAIIGTVYARIFLDIANPTVALLNVGKEEGKGNRLARETYPLLAQSGLNFIGNVEGEAVLSGEANVIVCDAFVGNCLFKLCECGGNIIGNFFRGKSKSFPLASLFKGKIKQMMSILAPPNSVGGGLIWGIDGIAVKIHGHSQAAEVASKLEQTRIAVEKDVVGCLKTELSEVRKKINVN